VTGWLASWAAPIVGDLEADATAAYGRHLATGWRSRRKAAREQPQACVDNTGTGRADGTC